MFRPGTLPIFSLLELSLTAGNVLIIFRANNQIMPSSSFFDATVRALGFLVQLNTVVEAPSDRHGPSFSSSPPPLRIHVPAALACFHHRWPLRHVPSQLCMIICRDEGYTFSGTQYAKECFCGDDDTTHTQHGGGECDYKCAGDTTQICGGYWSMNVRELK